MANCPSSCTGSVTGLLSSILDQEVAYFVRLSQVVQAFEASNSVPQSDQGNVENLVASGCSNSEFNLLSAILVQRIAIFNRLEQVLLAV